MKKQSKAAEIRTLLAEGVSVKDIAKKLKATEQYVAQVKWHWKKAKNIRWIKTGTAKAKEPTKLLAAIKDMEKMLPLVGQQSEWSAKDMVNSPDHYTVGGIETIDFIEAKNLGYHLGNAVKYISRAPHKGRQLEDLKKARWYLDREIENLEGEV